MPDNVSPTSAQGASPNNGSANSEEYNKALEDLKKSRKKAYALIILIVLLLCFAFYSLGSRSSAAHAAANDQKIDAQAEAISNLQAQLAANETTIKELTTKLDAQGTELEIANTVRSNLKEALETTERSLNELKMSAADIEAYWTGLYRQNVERLDLERTGYQGILSEVKKRGIETPAYRSVSDAPLPPFDLKADWITPLLDRQHHLSSAITALEAALMASLAPAVPTVAPSPASTVEKESQDRLPEELYAFLKSPEARNWNYTKDVENFARTGLTYNFKVQSQGTVVSVPFYAYDIWKQRLRELESKGLSLPPQLYSFLNYERFARTIPYLQSIGLYVDPSVKFQAPASVR